MTKGAREDLWMSRITRFKRSGLALSKWCAANDVNASTFSYWLKKEDAIQRNDENTTTHQWISLEISQNTSPIPNNNKLIVKIGKANIEIGLGFDPILLSDVIKVLSEIC